MTTQKYYTPVGRSIQRPYSSEEEYYYENFAREDVPKVPENAAVFHTETGRTVYGGGGITPDVHVKEADNTPLVNNLLRVAAFSRFIAPLGHEARQRYEKRPELLQKDFLAFVNKELPLIEIDKLEESRARIQLFLRAELALGSAGLEARSRVLTRESTVVRQAIGAIKQAEHLLKEQKVARQRRAAAQTLPR